MWISAISGITDGELHGADPHHRVRAHHSAVPGGLARDGGMRSGLEPRRHFHWVETPNPAAMKPKPTRMFQLCQLSTGQLPLVT